ncbi:unnamed protein product [Ectocarpus fasciculatus]
MGGGGGVGQGYYFFNRSGFGYPLNRSFLVACVATKNSLELRGVWYCFGGDVEITFTRRKGVASLQLQRLVSGAILLPLFASFRMRWGGRNRSSKNTSSGTKKKKRKEGEDERKRNTITCMHGR